MEKIVLNLWFDKEAADAVAFYASTFENSKILGTTILNDTPSGTVDIWTIDIENLSFMMMNGGPFFKINPSISFMISCKTDEEVKHFWEAFMEGGSALMPLDTYPFSPLYGWVIDRFGISWQVMHVGDQEITSKITPSIMYVGDQCGKAEEAVKFYTTIFKPSRIGYFSRYGEGLAPNSPEMVNYVDFDLLGIKFSAMDSALEHDFSFNEAISLVVNCDSQEELDYYWDNLSADSEAEQCGWLKDKFGVSWQIVPSDMDEVMRTCSREALDRITEVVLNMKKLDIEIINRAYNG